MITGELTTFTVTKSPDATVRHACQHCGGRIFNSFQDYPRTIFPDLCANDAWFEPQMHLYWENRRIEVVDALPKFLDFPKEFGGTGRRA